MNNHTDYQYLLKEIFATLSKFGPKKTAQLLSAIRNTKNILHNNGVKNILAEITEEFKISVEELMRGTGRKNYRSLARGFFIYYLKDVYNYEIDIISFSTQWERSMCYDYLNEVENLDPGFDEHKKFIEIKNSLDQKFKKITISNV